ncbi:MAG: zinc-ribbon domain-containing protein [Bradyrhizobium sp.]|nr:zinc-ribbon domain-containing protein [Bradyrhizobium sp.]
MHIVCPHCTTSYAINPAALGATGRTVRCARCKEVWLARPEDAVEPAPAMAEMGVSSREREIAPEWNEATGDEAGNAPHIESPSIAGGWQSDDEDTDGKADWIALVRDADETEREPRGAWFGSLLEREQPVQAKGRLRLLAGLPTTVAAMSALVVALLVWRADVVRLLPQTANFYKMVGLNVNLRGVAFKDVKVSTEIVEGKPVLVIEGMIVGETKKPVELPRLRFSVRDSQGSEIYAWNTVLDQAILQPGDRASFRSRLASPPAEGRSIDIRFFNRRDVAGGSI